MSGYSNNPYANPYGPSYPGGVNNPSSSHPAASTSTAGPVYQPYAGPMQAAYTGSSDAYSAYATPSDPSARFNLLEADTHRAAFDASMAQQSSIYTPEAVKKGGFGGPGGARKTVIRKGGGETWEDQSLMEWDPGESLSSPPHAEDATDVWGGLQLTSGSSLEIWIPRCPTTCSCSRSLA